VFSVQRLAPTGQFVPFAKQTDDPFTAIAAAFNDVPLAAANPNHDVDVPLVNDTFEIEPFVANRLVEVVLVPVALTHVRFVNEDGDEPVTVRLAIEAFVAEKFVVVAFVKTPVDGVTAPIGVPLIAPPLIVALDEMSVGAERDAIAPD